MPMLAAGGSWKMSGVLRDRSIFAGASAQFLEEIVQVGTVRVYAPGDRIIQQGMEGTSMFVLRVGSANVVKESADGAETGRLQRTLEHVGTLAHGAVFGELATGLWMAKRDDHRGLHVLGLGD
ncbi:unnamed protein product [Prorocentrum cordatum]|uniref:Cyclic nucleotide-binding domain-containing protein n=1 Tax=Prorocentrum cordatum TaxID=2364126 RepID=A0ABN9UW75_9DINO|nr:unnamed protein product [Polarella glacialis]